MPQTFADILKFNPYHDSRGRFASASGAASFTYAPGKSTAHDAAIQRGKDADKKETTKGFKGTLYHGSPETDIEEFDMDRAGQNTSSGEKLLFFTDSKQMAEDFSYERLEGSSKYFQRRGKKGRVYEVDVEMKNPLDFRNLSDKDIDNILNLDVDGILTKDMVKMYAQKNHQLLKSGLELTAESLKSLGYDGLIANTGKAGHNSLEYAVVDSRQAKIKKAAPIAKTFDDVLAKRDYVRDERGRFASTGATGGITPGPVNGTDLSKTGFKFDPESEDSPIEQVVRAQNYNSPMAVTNDRDSFRESCVQSNIFAVRGLQAENNDLLTKYDAEMKSGNAPLKPEGYSHGSGLYFASVPFNGSDALTGAKEAMDVGIRYSKQGNVGKVYTATLDKSAKITTKAELMKQMSTDQEWAETLKAAYGENFKTNTQAYNLGVYAAYKGFDGYVVTRNGQSLDSLTGKKANYTVIQNMSKVIIYEPPTVAKQAPDESIDDLFKFNPYHDARGRFASSGAATSFTIRTKDPSKQHLADAAAARERERDAAGGGAAPAEEKETPRMQSIHNVEDRIRNQNYESAAIIDKDGNELLFKDGAQSSVGFTPAECRMMKDSTLTHNHPRSSMFSDEDIQCFVRNEMEEIRATTREGVTYSVKRGEGYTKADGTVFLLEYQINSGLARATAQGELDARGFAEKIMRGEMSHTEANKEFGKVVTRELTTFCENKAPEYNLEFSVETRNVSKSASTEEYVAKASGDGDNSIVLDQKTEDLNDAAFNAWLEKNNIPKEEDTQKAFSIFKTDDDKRLVFGWASVSFTVDGEQLEDLQHDMIDPDDLEEAAYEYVLNFRDTGELHNPNLRKKGKLVESCVFTAEKQKAMGIPEGTLPIGWWIGFKIEDDDAWEKVKKGIYKMFSIEGKANRVPVEKAAPAEDPGRFVYIEEFP